MSAVAMNLDTAALGVQNAQGSANAHKRLRQACDQFAGMAFFGQMLKQARDSSLKSELLDSPGQQIFQQQMDDVLVQRASGKLGFSLGEALYRQLAPALGSQPPVGVTVDQQA